MSAISSVVGIINKALIKATAAGDTRGVNKLTKLADTPDAVTNRIQQIEAKQAEYGDTQIDSYIHKTNAQNDLNEGNFNYRSGTTPAATGRGEGIFTSPTSSADKNAAYGSREFGVVTERADAPKLGQGTTRLNMDGPDVPETFIPENTVQEIFEIKPPTMQLTDIGNQTVKSLAKATEGFKTSTAKMRKSNDIKAFFNEKESSDENVIGMFVDTIRVIDENIAGQTKKIGVHEKVYERVSMQDLYDKVGRKIESRMTVGTKDRWKPAKRREAGAIMINYARGNLGEFIEEAMVKTKTGKGIDVKDELLLTTNKSFKDWARTGGRTLMNALEGPREARNPSMHAHGDWVMNEAGELVNFPRGATKIEFLSGGSKTELSESHFPSVIKSLNILGKQTLGMDKDFFKLTKTLGKKGFLNERPGPLQEYRDNLNLQRLTDGEQDELTAFFDEVSDAIKVAFPDKKPTAKEFITLKEKLQSPRIKALEAISKETKTTKNQYKSKQTSTRRLDEELDKRFANDPEAKVYMQHSVDTRGRTSPVDPSGASLNSGGAIRHGFTGQSKPIQYGDEAFNHLVDDLVLFDSMSGLSKLKHTGLERHAHFKKNEAKYMKQGNDALDNVDNPDWNPSWMNRKDAGPYLRGVMEVARVKKANDAGVPYESNMMIEVDAPSSGSQHIGAQYGDKEILELTSVISKPVDRTGLTNAEKQLLLEGVPEDSASLDLYTSVGVKYKKYMETAYNDLAKTDPEKAALFKQISDEFLAGDRGIVKPIVMKVPYGAGNDRLKLNLNSQLDGRKKLEILDRGVDPDELMEFHWNSGMAKALNDGLKTQYEFKQFNSVIGNIFNKAKNRKPLIIEGPSGDKTDLTRYVMGSERTFRSTIPAEDMPNTFVNKGADWRGQEVTVYNQLPKFDISPEAINKIATDAKMVTQGMAPNVTHMMDAAFLHKLVQAGNAAGIEVRVVHDAFFVHPGDVKKIKALSGKVFQDMHANYNIRQKMIDGLVDATGLPVEEVMSKIASKMGPDFMKTNFDISSVPVDQMTNVIRGG